MSLFLFLFFHLSIFAGIPSFNPRTAPPGTRAFQESTFGEKISSKIPVYSHWNLRFRHTQPSMVRFNFTIPVDTSFGVYGRKNGSPSHTRYDFAQVLPVADGQSRMKRYVKVSISVWHSRSIFGYFTK